MMKRTAIRLTVGLCLTASAFGIAAGIAVGTAGAVTTRPSAPTNVRVLAQSNQIQVSWSAPTSAGTSAITGFAVNGHFANVATACATTATSCTITGVTSGHRYIIQVRAHNLSGFGTYSAPVTVLAGAPYPPTGLSATPGNASAAVKFIPPAVDNASITSFTITANPGGQTCVSTTSFPCTVTGLTNGTSYLFTGTSTNPYGTSVASAPSSASTPRTVPSAPTAATATAGNASALVSWTAPASNGAPITSFKVTSSPGAKTCTSATTSCTVSGLTNGTSYSFTVAAANAAGAGSPSMASSPIVPATVPTSPTAVTATLDTSNPNNYAWYSIGFTQAAGNGSPITQDSVTVTDLTNPHTLGPVAFSAGSPVEVAYANTADGTSSGAVVASPGDTLQFTVTAVNSVGSSLPSAATTVVLPDWTPPAPTGVSATADGTTASAIVSWTAPSSPPNTPAIASYLVTDGIGHLCTATAPTASCTVTGLASGTSYNFAVTAISAAGVTGAASAVASVTTAAAPNVLSAVVNGDGSVDVTFTPNGPGRTILGNPGYFTAYAVATDTFGNYSTVCDGGITDGNSLTGLASSIHLAAGTFTSGCNYELYVSPNAGAYNFDGTFNSLDLVSTASNVVTIP